MENYLAPAQRLWHFLGLSSRKRHLKKKKGNHTALLMLLKDAGTLTHEQTHVMFFALFWCVLCFFFFFSLCCFMFVSNKASTYGLSPIVLLNSLPVKKKLKTDSKPRSFI